jgi:DnaJ-class molecular chaperone
VEQEQVVECWVCAGTGCYQNGEPCETCRESGRLRVLVLGPAVLAARHSGDRWRLRKALLR